MNADERVYLAPSTIPGAGDGLFAKLPFALGDKLEVTGVLIEAGSIADACTRYADRYKFRLRDKLLIPTGYASMANHSDRPNMEKIIESDTIYLRALRAIAAGEELCFTYSDFARTQFK